MADAKDRTDISAQIIAAEALAMALAKFAVAGMSDRQKADFRASVIASGEAFCGEVMAQAPAIGRNNGISVQAANIRATNLTADARALIAAHLDTLLGS